MPSSLPFQVSVSYELQLIMHCYPHRRSAYPSIAKSHSRGRKVEDSLDFEGFPQDLAKSVPIGPGEAHLRLKAQEEAPRRGLMACAQGDVIDIPFKLELYENEEIQPFVHNDGEIEIFPRNDSLYRKYFLITGGKSKDESKVGFVLLSLGELWGGDATSRVENTIHELSDMIRTLRWHRKKDVLSALDKVLNHCHIIVVPHPDTPKLPSLFTLDEVSKAGPVRTAMFNFLRNL